MSKVVIVVAVVVIAGIAYYYSQGASATSSPTSAPTLAIPTFAPTPPPITTTNLATEAYAMLTFSPPTFPYPMVMTQATMDSILASRADPVLLKKAGLTKLTMSNLSCYLFFSNIVGGIKDPASSPMESDLCGVWFLTILQDIDPILYKQCQYIDTPTKKIMFIPDGFFDQLSTRWRTQFYTLTSQSVFFLRNYGIQPGLDTKNSSTSNTNVIQTMDDLVNRVVTYLFFNLRGKMRSDALQNWRSSCTP